MRITYSVAASRDGFIARKDGDVSWLDEQGIATEDTGLAEFFSAVDGLIMGRKTYDFVFDYGMWPYENKLTWVLTSRALQKLDGANLQVSRSIDDVISAAEQQSLQHLWLLGGGQLASAFLDKQLLSHVSIAEMPIELGEGIPLFARHSLDDLPCIDKSVQEKKGFRQLDMLLK